MSLVTVAQLHHRCNSPQWNAEQRTDAQTILDEVQSELEGILQAPIEPTTSRLEHAPILDSGLVCPRWPVYSVQSIDGVTVDDTHLLDPLTWLLEGGWLRRVDSTGGPALAPTSSLDPFRTPSGSLPHVGYAQTTVALVYTPGWGPVPALTGAMLRVAQARMLNRHDDTLSVRDMDGQPPPALPEDFDDAAKNRLSMWKWRHIYT